jgi:hypothetical protein
MPLIITPPLSPCKPHSDIDWQKFHWYQVSLNDQESLIVDTMQSSMKLNKEKDALTESCKKVEADHKKNTARIINSINQF